MRPRRLWITVDQAGDACWVSGYGSRDLITALTGRPPMWSTRRHAWHTSARRAPDLLALADLQGYETELTERAA